MAGGEMIEVGDAAGGREEVLFLSELTRVVRRHLADGSRVICKELLGPNALMRLQHERGILERVAAVPGVPRLVQGEFPPCTIATQDAAALSLEELFPGPPPSWDRVLDLALGTARILGALHRAGVAHRNLTPSNILLAGEGGTPEVIDFSLATAIGEERPPFVLPHEIAGTLPYLAPEQTGRTGRPVDQRADLYALGVTLYRVCTGRLPFRSQDPLQLIHEILAATPPAPAQLVPGLPRPLSDIIVRLLEKEPDRRYQSAEGVTHDLVQAREALSCGADAPFPLGGSDFPLRLPPPSRPVGRDSEIARIGAVFQGALAGEGSLFLLTGGTGVGKTTLVNELRPAVSLAGGWFLSGKFDQYRRDLSCDAVHQAVRALGRLLLAEPERSLPYLRQRLLGALGGNAGLLAGLQPELALLLKVPPEEGADDPLKEKGRLTQGALDLFGAIAALGRPMVIFLDDLQWGSATPLSFIDALALQGGIPGVLVVGAFRDQEVESSSPLAALLQRWERLPAPPGRLHLENLPQEGIAALLEEMLHLDREEAIALSEEVGERTAGNPFDTVELVNALRRDGGLFADHRGWRWNREGVRRYLGAGDIAGLVAARIRRLPEGARRLLDMVASLGGRVELTLLVAASGIPSGELEGILLPALEEGLLVLEKEGKQALRFAHDRVQQAAYRGQGEVARLAGHLHLARSLAPQREYLEVAADQYLLVLDALHDEGERRRAALLFRAAARRGRALNFAKTEAFLAAAHRILSQGGGEDPLLMELEVEWHSALHSLARLEDGDHLFRSIEGRSSDPLRLVGAACLQISSLSNRGRQQEAMQLGLELLRRLGFAAPLDGELPQEMARGLDLLAEWVGRVVLAEELRRPDAADAAARGAARLINRLIPTAHFGGYRVGNWLVLLGQRLWVEYGPCAPLAGPLAHWAFVTIGARRDYLTGYRVMSHVLSVAESRGYEPDTSQVCFLFCLTAAPWFRRLEECIELARRALEGLLQGGDLQNSCFTYYVLIPHTLDCGATLDACLAEIDGGLALASRTGNAHAAATFENYRHLARLLRGEGAEGELERHRPGFDGNIFWDVHHRVCCALGALLVGEPPDLARCAAEAIGRLGVIEGCYGTSTIYLAQGLALAQRLRAGEAAQDGALFAELDLCCGWLKERAADAPQNFLHLYHLVAAERAWALEDFRGALGAFDAALAGVPGGERPWHGALIAERAALFHLAHDLRHTGRQLMADARSRYERWGAAAKVRRLDRAHPFLSEGRGGERRSAPVSVSSDAVDLLAVLRASQALSSETSLSKLHAQVVDLLGALTGATSVSLLLWREGGWSLLPAALELEDGEGIPLEEAGALIPVSVVRYAERTAAPLLVDDAKRDDRFGADPYLAALESCSLLLVPIYHHGAPSALLVLENRLSRGAFTVERLDAVTLMAGQLAVSLENALLYQELEARVAERTRELQKAQSELMATARQAGMAEVATNVLHNVGNVLNSVNVSAEVAAQTLRDSSSRRLAKAVRLLNEQGGDLAGFLTGDERGRLLPRYLERVSSALESEREGVLGELERLTGSVNHIKEIVATQQSYAGACSMIEQLCVADLMRDALRMSDEALRRHGVTVLTEIADLPAMPLDRGRLLQILVNLISNAKYAMNDSQGERRLTLAAAALPDGRLRIEVRDEGEGIAAEHLSRIFSHGFTTKKGGHGFGLHSCALAAREMGGTLSVASDGPGRGATFTLELPPGGRGSLH